MSETALAAPRGRGVWVARLATAVILVSLVTLMVAPAYIERRVTPERGRVERADQGRALGGLGEFALALEMSALRGFLISGDSTFLHTYTAAQRSELALYPRLEVLLDDAAPRLRARLDDLRQAAAGWERDADAEEIVRRRRSSSPIAGVSTEQAQFERALRAAAALDAALAHESELARARIREAEQLRFVITVGLVVLSLASAAAATWFARRVRLLGREAAARRDQAEAALAEL